MTATTALLLVVLVWLLIGIVASVVMARRGHDLRRWGALGALWGPLVIPLAVSTHNRSRSARGGVVHAGATGPGPIYVLAGVDGSADSEAAAVSAVQLLGTRLGRLTLATVVDYDTAEAAATHARPALAAAHEMLDDACEAVRHADPDTVVLTGRPADALLDHAHKNDIDLIVVGARGRGLTRAVVGHVTSRLARQRDIPVLMAGTAEVDVDASLG
jgi:nucleotide-binding universal stress UspA family protein